MAQPRGLIDPAVHLEAFLLSCYTKIFEDETRSLEERLERRVDLESFILSHGARMLSVIGAALSAVGPSDQNFDAISWYTEFASSLSEDWIEQVSSPLLGRAWQQFRRRGYRRQALELMAKKEWLKDRLGNDAVRSSVVQLFENLGRAVGTTDSREDQEEILGSLLKRAALTDPASLGKGRTLGNYCIKLARFCWNSKSVSIGEDDISRLLKFCPELDTDHVAAVSAVLRTTRIDYR